MLLDQPLPDPPRRVTLLARRLPSASSHPSMIRRYAPNAGAGRPYGARFAGGTADSNACLTARRCTPWRLASSLIDNPSRA